DPEHGAVLPRDEGPSDELLVATRCPTGAVVVSSAGRIGVARVGGGVLVGWTAVGGGHARVRRATVGRAVVHGAASPHPRTRERPGTSRRRDRRPCRGRRSGETPPRDGAGQTHRSRGSSRQYHTPHPDRGAQLLARGAQPLTRL